MKKPAIAPMATPTNDKLTDKATNNVPELSEGLIGLFVTNGKYSPLNLKKE